MDQIISTFGIDWKLLLAQSINFVLLLAVLSYFLYKPVVSMLNTRQEMAKKAVADAHAAEKALNEIESTRTEKIQLAEKDAQEMVARAKASTDESRVAVLKEAAARAENVLVDAKAQAEELKRAALKESEAEVAKLVILGAEKVLQKSYERAS